MRRALAPTPATVITSQSVTLPAPTGGLNTRDNWANMPPTDAISMDNFFPETTDVRTRPGSATYASGLNGAVETIFSYTRGTTLRMFVAVGGTFQNISTVATNGTVVNGTVATGFSNDRWQYRNFGTPGGQFMVAVNNADAREIYDGSVWFQGSVYSASTIDVFSNIEIFQRRILYTEKNTLRFVYHVHTDSIGGTVATFDLAELFDMGGYLQAIGTWTRDGGAGMDDLAVFITNYGQMAIYQGTDPGDANSWSMIGVYKVPQPVSYRCMAKLGGELLVGTKTGVIPMSAVTSGLVQQALITDKIKNSIDDAWEIYKNNWGWELKNITLYNWLIFNVPVATNNFQQQYVMNSHIASWCRFKGLYANTWEMHNNTLYYGGDGVVVEAGTGESDDGNDIEVDVRQAAAVFGAPGRQKQFKMFQPLINTDGALALAADINVDFADVIPTNIPTAVALPIAEWDVATWDDYYWAGDPIPASFWQSTGRYGTYGSVRLKGAVNETQVRWLATNVVFEFGGML